MHRRALCVVVTVGLVRCGICGVSSLAADGDVPSSAGELSHRVAESKLLLKGFHLLSPGGRAAFAHISEAGDRLGRMLTYREYMQALRDAPDAITQKDFSALYWMFREAQKP